MSLHMEVEADIQVKVVTEFGHGGVLLTLVRSEEDGMWGVKIEYLHENIEVDSTPTAEEYEALLDNRFSQVLAFPALEQAEDVYNALRACTVQKCTCKLN